MFITRTISAVILAIVALVTIVSGGAVLTVTLYFLSVVAFYELTKAAGVHSNHKMNGLEMAGLTGITVYYALMLLNLPQIFMIMAVLLTLIAMMFVYVFTFPQYRAEQIMAAFFSVIYAPVMLSFIYLTRELRYGIYLVWMIFVSSWICDTCAYLTGVVFGRHKLAPNLSPKKSVEGAVGGIAGAALVGALFGYFIVDKVIPSQEITWIFALIGAIGAMISQVGDLAASGIKRNHEIKDYGKLIPGHGGVMDRFDSVIFTAPIIYFLMIFLIR